MVNHVPSNALSIAVVRGAPLATRVLLLLGMARFASPEDLARVAYVIAIAEALKLIGDGGFDIWAVRALGRTRLSSIAFAKLMFGCVGSVLAVVLAGWSGQSGIVLAGLAGLFVLAGEMFGIALIHHVARLTPHDLLPVSVVSALGILIAGGGALVMGAGATMTCGIIGVGEALAAVYVLAKLRAVGELAFFPGIMVTSFSALREALPSTVYSAIVAAYSRLDAIVLNAYSAAALASYTVAFRATQPFSFVFGALALAAYAAPFGTPAQRSSAPPVRLRTLLVRIFAGASVAALVTYVVCAWLISSVAPYYADSLPTLQVLCVLLPIVAVNNVSTYVLLGNGMFRTVLTIVTMNLISTSTLLLLLVPTFGARGAALSLLGCQVLNGCALLVVLFRQRLVPATA